MPSIRVGFSTDLNITGGLTGIGTTNPAARLDVAGQITVEDTAGSGGVSTFREYQGFSQVEAKITNNVTIDNGSGGPFGSLTGEIKITGETTVSSGSTVEVGKTKTLTVTDRFAVPLGETNNRDNAPEAGTTRFNQDFGTLEFFDGANWKTVNSYSRGGAAGRGVYGGGENPGISSRIDYLNLTSGGNALNFGDLTDERFQLAGASSSIRGLFAGGDPGPSNSDVIEYVTIASAGNGIDFGNLITAGRLSAAASSSTRAIFAGENKVNVISYVEINTTGNAVDFGDITTASGDKGTATSSPTRFVYASGNSNPKPQIIEYGTIASKGNTVTFGDLTYGGNGFRMPKATSNGIRGIFAGGYDVASPNVGLKDICYITMATTGNATEFGDLIGTRQRQNCMSSQTKSIQVGGQSDASGSGDNLLTIEAIDYASDGNAIEFGDTNDVAANGTGLSDCHGGLGGF